VKRYLARVKPNKWQIIFGGAAIALTVLLRTFWTPDTLFIFLLIYFWLGGKGRNFFYSFAPFIALLLVYDSLRGLVPLLTHRVHFTEMIKFDQWVGHGTAPSNLLQNLLYHGHLNWYDFYFYALYIGHFFFPLMFAVILWQRNLRQYFRFVVGLTVLSYAAFITFIAFPAAPPWMASDAGLIPTLHKVSTDIWWAMGVHNFSQVYNHLNPNPVAAVPSLHSAYPFLVSLFVFREWGRKIGLISLIYPMSIWLGVVYMGEHYLFDVVVGVAYASLAFIAVNYISDRYKLDDWLLRLLESRLDHPFFRRRKAEALGAAAIK
jgi:hypothetical protein